ncbi:hypothetical protein [Algoriphagus sp.]|uniref:hypothetical protein n=1 Tax=Algoriphagus sp. TaxID=1872435 RepID=UPI003918EC29
MDFSKKPINLALWLDADLIQRQNELKAQFTSVLMEVENSLSAQEFHKISPKSKGTKLSKGNDLLGYPYQVLDIIRDFDPNNGANIRILNWFGNGLYITVLLGKGRKNPVTEFREIGFYFGLSENQWDYPDLILNKNYTGKEIEINEASLGFYHWIIVVDVNPNSFSLKAELTTLVKKILGILTLSL